MKFLSTMIPSVLSEVDKNVIFVKKDNLFSTFANCNHYSHHAQVPYFHCRKKMNSHWTPNTIMCGTPLWLWRQTLLVAARLCVTGNVCRRYTFLCCRAHWCTHPNQNHPPAPPTETGERVPATGQYPSVLLHKMLSLLNYLQEITQKIMMMPERFFLPEYNLLPSNAEPWYTHGRWIFASDLRGSHSAVHVLK